MIDIIDPNLHAPPPPPAAEVQPVEPIKTEAVKVQEERLEDRKSQEEDLRKKRDQARKDRVELSSLPKAEQPDSDGGTGATGMDEGNQDEHKIDLLI
ncbi:MAG: hypothetical protein IIB42_00090 [Candidatus Marinimicrobia bacterium]|nr:hypothetical protein [Candidatus Neomarinimicrobiota bacterium]MCH7858170.1 hypothetical protein [Candidatus Neomarinimicrobiota bacterium]